MHFVGSIPEPLMTSYHDALEWIVDHSAGQPLTALPCDLDPVWIVGYLRDLGTRTKLLEFQHTTDDYADYNVFPSGRIRPGVTLEPEHLSMQRFDKIAHIVEAYTNLRQERAELANVKLQLSQPNPLDLTLFIFAGAAVADGLPLHQALHNVGDVATALRNLELVTEAVLDEIAAVTRVHGSLITWQVESPVALLSVVKAAQLKTKTAVAVLVAHQLARFLTRLHAIGAHASLHLCYGDYQHTALLQPRSTGPAVALLNALARQLRRHGTPLPDVHIPCAYGAEPAPLDPRFYLPLRSLDSEWTLTAGVVSPASVIDSMVSLRLFEQSANRAVHAVATACGLGRCPVDLAEQAAAATAAVAAFSEHWLPAAALDDYKEFDATSSW
ncbi:hypothetical protein ACQPW1_22480 [Nocardia sp. CA-128927]|uniref:hypothetical protein n=1 Tax=Nocardia sp. CA-128927 TaxID=3239975 RepID=UPI003D9770A7